MSAQRRRQDPPGGDDEQAKNLMSTVTLSTDRRDDLLSLDERRRVSVQTGWRTAIRSSVALGRVLGFATSCDNRRRLIGCCSPGSDASVARRARVCGGLAWDEKGALPSAPFLISGDGAWFKGKAKIDGDWEAGYLFEVGIRSANSKRVNQLSHKGDDNPEDVGFRSA